jgi:hypothetical protein
MSQTKSSNDRLRADRNRDLIRRMNNGENLTTFSSAASWFPPRPTIAKDPQALAQLYGSDRMTETQQVETAQEVRLESAKKSVKTKGKLQLV